MKKQVQIVQYNLLKILAVFMVIAVHMMNVVELVPPGNQNAFRFHEVLRTFLLTSNGLFFMVSGRFLLDHYDGRMGRFYWKRFVKIGIPVLTASLFYYVYVYGRNGISLSFWKAFLSDLLQSRIQGYFWFVYALAGFYLAVPFLSVMFAHMGKKEKRALAGITLAYFGLQNLYQIFELEMVFTSYLFYSWVFYCILGYLLDSLELSGRQIRLVILAGMVAFFVSAWEICFWERENPALHNYSVTMILMTNAVYLAVTVYGKKLADRCSGIIQFIAKRSFYIYIFHGLTQITIGAKLGAGGAKVLEATGVSLGVRWGYWFCMSAASFVMALFIGCGVDWIYEPVSRRLLNEGKKLGKQSMPGGSAHI